jgi:hypothetical protein
MTKITETALEDEKNGAFVSSCNYHCGMWNDLIIDEDTPATAFTKFYESSGKREWL